MKKQSKLKTLEIEKLKLEHEEILEIKNSEIDIKNLEINKLK